MPERIPRLNVVIVGDVGVGKRALADQICPEESYDPTLEDSWVKRIDVDRWPCVLDILLLDCPPEYTALRDQYIRDGDAFILAYSVTSQTSFSNIRTYDNDIKNKEKLMVGRTTKYSSSQRPCNPPVILVGTKNDLEAQREVSVEEGQMLAQSLNCPFIETSAKHNTGVEKMLHEVVRCYRQQNPPTPSEPETPTPSRSRKGLGRLLGPRQPKNDNGPRCIVM
ncbi:hypothetical protein N7491_010973 [Penicillium cf. griseofulvum]|uniref:Uncharacterized protein n=1 Tax=Penicillium cf. griseofulvum TaxID=2972120 RepID=A0A9W9N0T4_9EURO|nr:hypothetical protein N7472_001292 [Penicillium cf. griseofulvum]KAJ5422528.1 hypothetical protein N7491_010973 [Penicillium cf. griseofulvum]KAJ5428705.1 hypothetical protein N7445_010159 [Penicillium cf. griseofulvum]